MRLEVGGVDEDSILYLPDGSRYIFGATGDRGFDWYATKFTDSSGNITAFSQTPTETGELRGAVTDTVGRTIEDPLDQNKDVRLEAGNQSINLPGIGENTQNYELTWTPLSKVRQNNEEQPLSYKGVDVCFINGGNTDKRHNDGPIYDDPNTAEDDDGPILFGATESETRVCSSLGGGDRIFNPVVLSEVLLPNNTKYSFKYNQYGEITEILYPTGSRERFEYGQIVSMGRKPSFTYDQTNRGVKKRWVYNSDDSLEQYWEYNASINGNQYPIPSNSSYVITTIQPDGTKSERYLERTTDEHFGFTNPGSGMPKEERFYSSTNQLLRRNLTEWQKTGNLPNGTVLANRDARVSRTISILIEGSQALATMSENIYQDPSVDSGVPSDPSYFAALNVKESKSHHYANIPLSLAQSGTLAQIAGYFGDPTLATLSQTDYLYDPDYRDRGISSLAKESRTLDPVSKQVLTKGQVIYDNQLPAASSAYPGSYSIENYSLGSTLDCGVPQNPKICWQSPAGSDLGRPTTSRTWKADNNTWIETHARFDVFGNAIKTRDPIENEVTTEFSSGYKYAYPTKVITPAPDPTNTHGTSDTSTGETTYDFMTGLPLVSKDDFGQEIATEYDGILRPKRVSPVNFTGPVSETDYNDTALTVTSRKQIDANNWSETIVYQNSLGQTIKTKTKDSQGDVFVETEYDQMGRVEKTTNPYRANDTIYWNKVIYDEMGRPIESFAPAQAGQTGTSLGTTVYDISTVPGYTGTVVTTTDAASKQNRSITNALGQLIRVDEPDYSGGVAPLAQATPNPSPSPVPTPTPYEPPPGCIAAPGCLTITTYPSYSTTYRYNALGKMVEVTQGEQKRFFLYDNLGRLLRVRQPEQEINPNLQTSGNPDNNDWTAGFTYDVVGNVLTATDAKGTVITNTYDKAGRVVMRSYSDSTPIVYFYYDGKGLVSQQSPKNYAKGRLTLVDSSVSQTSYKLFDNFGRLKEMEQRTPIGAEQPWQADARVSKYIYSLSGALIEEEYPSGRKVKNEFESDGDLKRIFGSANSTAAEQTFANSFSFTASGGIGQMKLGNGRWETAQFNSRQQVKQLGLGNSATDASLWKIDYQYGELNTDGSVNTNKNTGNIAKQTLTIPGTNFTQNYKYDTLYRLTEAKEFTGTSTTNPNWTQAFGYDLYGNRTSFSQNIGGVQVNTTPVINANTNRFTSTNFTYDKNGNITGDVDPVTSSARQFIFNGDNKQLEVNTGSTNVGKYYYDGEGKRVKKVTATETTIFVYSGGKLVAEYSTQVSQNPTISYMTGDHLGSPRIITDKVGNVKSRRDFMPFGEDVFAGIGGRTGDSGQKYSSGADDIRQKFTGYQKDNETSLDFAEARMYENRFGRFTAVDPLLASGKSATPQTFNRYIYVGNNPLRRVDPAGEDWWDVTNKVNGNRNIVWFDEDPDEEAFDVNDRWEDYLYHANDSRWYALNPEGPEYQGFSEYERAYWQYGLYVDFGGAYEGILYDLFSVNDGAHMIADMKTGNVEGSLYYFGKISLINGAGFGAGKFICGRNTGGLTSLSLKGGENAAAKTAVSLVPKAMQSLGKWGEARLVQVLGGAGEKPAKALATSLGNRFVDRLVNGIAHEAKAGFHVRLTSTIRKQILKDAELIVSGRINGAHWHFFQGAQQEVLDFLTQNGIKYTVY